MSKIFWALLLSVSLSAFSSSLYNEASFKPLTADKKAAQPGDTVTILVMENAQAKSSAGRAQERENSLSMHGRHNDNKEQLSVGVGGNTAADAAINRNGFVKAQITAVVQSRDQNGNLEVSGDQQITIDGEMQSIEIRGWIRPTDISANNVVPSFRLFNARIRFIGEGDISDSQKAGIFSKIFGWLGL